MDVGCVLFVLAVSCSDGHEPAAFVEGPCLRVRSKRPQLQLPVAQLLGVLQQSRAAADPGFAGIDIELINPGPFQDEERHEPAALVYDPRSAPWNHLRREPGQHIFGVVDGSGDGWDGCHPGADPEAGDGGSVVRIGPADRAVGHSAFHPASLPRPGSPCRRAGVGGGTR
jgi:hypothetical protein